MPRTILHVGTHKTGTTTIQHFADANRELLQSRGLIYPGYDLVGLRNQPAHHDLARALSSDARGNFNLDLAKTFVAKVSEKYTNDDIILISAEPFYRHLIRQTKEDDIWVAREAYIARMAEVFAPLNPEILIVLRRQDEFAESLYQELIKSRGYPGDFSTFLYERSHFFQYVRQMDIFRKYFSSITVKIFEDMSGPNLADKFFNDLGVDTNGLKREKTRNMGWPIDFVLYAQDIYQACSKQKRLRIGELLQEIASTMPRTPPKERFFSPNERESFIQSFASDNEKILPLLGDPSRISLFPQNTIDLPGKKTLTDREKAEITVMVVNHLEAKIAEIKENKKFVKLDWLRYFRMFGWDK